MLRRLLRKPATWTVLVVLVAAAGFGLYWFQPWKLATNERVDDALSTPAAPVVPPAAAGSEDDAAGSEDDAAGSEDDEPATPPPPAGPVLLAEGEFISHEHTTTGTARLIRNSDGGHQLELVGLDTSNGPDLRVWLTDQPVLEGRDGWHVFDDGAWVELDRLKGNQGDQVYDIPAEVEPADYSSVSIWCRRFAVSFGAADLTSP